YAGALKYPSYALGGTKGKVQKLMHSTGFTAPLAKIRLQNGDIFFNVAPEKIIEGQDIHLGIDAAVVEGNILPLAKIPEGTPICNIEIEPGDGGKMVRSAGSNARVMHHIGGKVSVLLPSKQEKVLDGRARATIGIVAASGRKDKPVLKAGKKFFMMRATNRLWPRTSAVKMNAIEHPFGGGRGKVIGKPKTPPRFAPPGRKVGLLHARRTGRKKK
ncbi:MAG TPA: 50S ribosomal protein L2, partial [Nanoarchaeota archaeon]|nr:50S ribosomal protein L2 [Nanoarchaeota archaeon]